MVTINLGHWWRLLLFKRRLVVTFLGHSCTTLRLNILRYGGHRLLLCFGRLHIGLGSPLVVAYAISEVDGKDGFILFGCNLITNGFPSVSRSQLVL